MFNVLNINEIEDLKDNSLPVLIKFGKSDQCSACRNADKFLAVLERAYSNKIVFADIEVNLENAQLFQITKIPVFILYKNKQEKMRVVGFSNQIEFEKQLRIALKS